MPHVNGAACKLRARVYEVLESLVNFILKSLGLFECKSSSGLRKVLKYQGFYYETIIFVIPVVASYMLISFL